MTFLCQFWPTHLNQISNLNHKSTFDARYLLDPCQIMTILGFFLAISFIFTISFWHNTKLLQLIRKTRWTSHLSKVLCLSSPWLWCRIHGLSLWSPVALSLSSYLVKNDRRNGSWKSLVAGSAHWKSNLPCALLAEAASGSGIISAGEPGLCLSWQPRCVYACSRGSPEVRVRRRSRVGAGKTPTWTSCVTQRLILHRERENGHMVLWNLVSALLVRASNDKSQKQERK